MDEDFKLTREEAVKIIDWFEITWHEVGITEEENELADKIAKHFNIKSELIR